MSTIYIMWVETKKTSDPMTCILALNLYSCFRPRGFSIDKLPTDQQAAIAKSSSDRLRQTLMGAGEEEAIGAGALELAGARAPPPNF